MTDIWQALKDRYPAPEYATFFEVANGVGAHKRRYVDALVMSLFPSRGLDIHGFEIKIERADWLREKKDPDKAELIASYCDFWWLVIDDEKIVKQEEIPLTWGLLLLKGKTLRQVKKPDRLEVKALDRSFVASILRRADEYAKKLLSEDKALNKQYDQGYKEGREHEKNDKDHQLECVKREHNRLKEALDEFRKESGLEIKPWQGGNVGAAVKALMFIQQVDSSNQMNSLASDLETAARDFRKKATALEKYYESRRKENA